MLEFDQILLPMYMLKKNKCVLTQIMEYYLNSYNLKNKYIMEVNLKVRLKKK